jgi:uncharacterized membrane protein
MPVLYTDFWLNLAWLGFGLGIWRAVRAEAWHTIATPQITGWLASCIAILLLWQLKAQVQAGISFHILGSAALTLIAGQHRAMLGIAALLMLQALFGHIPWQSIALLWVLKGAIPILLCTALLHWAQNKLPHNYFVYIFFNCFFAAALSMWAYGLAHSTILALSGSYDWLFLSEEVLPYYFLMGWPEAFTTGLNLTILVVWLPHWVSTFDDAKYLQKRD